MTNRSSSRRILTSGFCALGVLSAALLGAQALTAQTRPDFPPDLPPDSPPELPTTVPDGSDPSLEWFFATKIERAHGIDAWNRQPAVQTDITIQFGDSQLFDGMMLYEPSTGRVRMDGADGLTMVFDGRQAWITEGREIPYGARFHLLTWPYFLAAPFKLRDPGATLKEESLRTFHGKLCRTARLTFKSGTGDTPGDWYLIYADPATHQLFGMAYIVTYGKPAAEAEKEPHAIIYEDALKVDGVVLSTTWKFHMWNESEGAHGEPIGEVTLGDIKFVKPDDDAFKRPDGTKEAPLP